jgi:hypothetical protein
LVEKSRKLQRVIDFLSPRLGIKEKITAVVIEAHLPRVGLMLASDAQAGLKKLGANAPEEYRVTEGAVLVATNTIPEEIWPGTVAHELGHLVAGDLTRWAATSRIAAFARSALIYLTPLLTYLIVSTWYKGTAIDRFLTSSQAIPVFLLYIAFALSTFSLCDHHREWKADKYAAQAVGPKECLKALE